MVACGVNGDDLIKFREIVLQGFRHWVGGVPHVHGEGWVVVIVCYPVDGRCVVVLCIEAKLVLHRQKDDDGAQDAEHQTGNVQQATSPMAPYVSPGGV